MNLDSACVHRDRPFSRSSARTAVLEGPGEFSIVERPLEPLQAQELRVRISACGVCGSNLPVWRGLPWQGYPLPPGAPGHEAIGVIQEIGDSVTDFAPGDWVCWLGESGFSEFESVRADRAIHITEEHAQAGFLGEPLACAMNIFRRSGITPGNRVIVIGVGFLGALLIRLAVSAGAEVFAASHRSYARSIAATSGAKVVTFEEAGALPRFDVTIEAAGVQSTLDVASSVTATRGRMVVAGYHQDGPRTVNMQEWNWRGIDVINAHERDPAVYLEGMRLAQDAVTRGKLSLGGLITHRFPLHRINEAFAVAIERPAGFMKAIITP